MRCAIMASALTFLSFGLAAPSDARQTNQADRTFLLAAAIGSLAEVEFGRIAEQKSHSDPVRMFARRMMRDHSDASNALLQLSRDDQVQLINQLDPDHQQVYDSLDRVDGPEFDIEYLRLQIQDHQRAVQLLEYEIGSGEDPDLKGFAAKTLPMVFTHLRVSRNLLAEASAQHPQIASAPSRISGLPTPQTQPPPNTH
jgi:putative membrane protein